MGTFLPRIQIRSSAVSDAFSHQPVVDQPESVDEHNATDSHYSSLVISCLKLSSKQAEYCHYIKL